MQRRGLAADDEEELLRLQAEFQATAAQGDARPAAKVTRVSRRPAATAASGSTSAAAAPQPAAGCAVHGPGCQGHHHAEGAATEEQQMAGLMAAMQSALKNIVGDVQERAVAAPPQPPAAPSAPAAEAAGGAFPAATHRKLSKFALGRQQQRSGGVAAAAAGPPAAQPAAGAAAAAEGAQDDESRIDAENRQLLEAMSQEQLEAAREEVLQRLPPAAAEFLRRRGAQKAAKAGPAGGSTTAAAGVQAGAESAGEEAAAAGAPPAPTQPTAAARPLPPRQQPQQSQLRAAPASGDSTSEASLAARLRFDVDGAVVGLRPAGSNADVSPAEVAERDPLRQEAGAAAEGYSIQEACLLARSSVPQQRVLALRLLRSVLTHSRPSVAASGAALVPLPAAVVAQLQEEGRQGAAGVEWVSVWHHALHAADVVLLLRRSLDDSHSAVVAAAAEALAALLGTSGPAGAAEEAAAEMADACTLTGWPVPAMRHMQRPTASGAWVAAPAAPQLHLDADDEDGGQEEALNEQQLAKVDPLSGLLHMSLLERIVYLLTTARAAAAVDPLLSILIRCCQAGKDVANQVLDTPGMTAALKSVLDAPPPPLPAGGGPPEAHTDATAAAFYAARAKALRLLRQLAQASKAAARQLQEEGLVRFALDQLLRPAGMAVEPAAGGSGGSSGNGGLKQRGQLAEALRLWRSFAQHGFYLLLLDDAYPSLCTHFTPPPLPVAVSDVEQEQLQQWAVAREAYAAAAQLCWHAARCEQHDSQLSPQCAAALAAEALGWLAGCPLQQVLESCAAVPVAPASGGSLGGGSGAAAVAMAPQLSAFPALAATMQSGSQQAVLLSSLAAVLHFVGSYWSTQTWHTAAEKAAAAQQLASLGLLPTVDVDGSSGSSSSIPAVQPAVSRLLEQLVVSDGVWLARSGTVAAAAVATAELAVALSRLAAAFLPQRQAAAAAASMLAPLHSQAAAARFLQAASAADATLSQPWDAARLAQLLPLARAASSGLQAALRTAGGGRGSSAAVSPAGVDTALALLRLLPAGDEPEVLQLLSVLLSPRQLASTAAAAGAVLQPAATIKVAQLVAGAADGRNSGLPSLPDMSQISQLLLAGYAAPWLAMVPEPEREGEQIAAAGPEPPANIALLRPQGSRLPLPADWMLQELPLPPAEAHLAASPGAAGEGALLLALGWEQQQLSSMGAAAPGDAAGMAEHKLRSSVLLLFGEQHEQRAQQGVVPGALDTIGEEEEEEDDRALWERPLARWLGAALMERYCTAAEAAAAAAGAAAGTPAAAAAAAAAAQATAGAPAGAAGNGTASATAVPADEAGSGLRGWQQQEARQLAEHFAAASYGDALFGAAVALLLRRTVQLDVQLEVLSVLADEQALHLLPPLRLLPGPPAAYLASPSSGGASAFGQACFGAGAAGSAVPNNSSGSSRRQETDLYLKLLSDGPLERCLAASSSEAAEGEGSSAQEGDGSAFATCSMAVPLVLHRLAAACFAGPDAGSAQQPAGQGQAHVLLCSILQRCSGGSPEQQSLLGMLLRWDTAAGAPSDALSQGRVAAIEAACSTLGIDARGMLGPALEA